MNPNSSHINRRALILGGLMAATSVGAVVGAPKPIVTSQSQVPDLEAMLPEVFGHWRIDRNIVPLQVSPEVAQLLSTLYDRTVSRTYVNDRNERIMLSVAYGANQSRALQLHRPEVCYVAQGFRLTALEKGRWELPGAIIPTMHLVGVLGGRVEPVTYWMRIGDDIARGWLEQNRVRLKYGTRGTIPDGVLFRVSNISSNAQVAYGQHRDFVQELMEAMSPQAREVFVGAVALGRAG